jgi:hypothetical protein
MRPVLAFAAIFVSIGMVSTSVAVPRNYCGWLINPTPMNFWLQDRTGIWTLSSMGSPEVAGFDRIDTGKGRWLRMAAGSPSAGFGCACITGETEIRSDKSRWFTNIQSMRMLAPSVCNNDPGLPKRDVGR